MLCIGCPERQKHLHTYKIGLEEVSSKGAIIFKAGYRGGRIFGGVPNFWSCVIGLSNISEKIAKYLVGYEVSGIYLRLK